MENNQLKYENKLNDYEEIPHPSYGHGFPSSDVDHSVHGLEHYGDFHHGHLPHHVVHQHYNHALAARTVLWPLAGLALLGAAAALVSNPILLQLGVATGKRRRRDTEELISEEVLDKTKGKYEKEDVLSNEINEESIKKPFKSLTRKLFNNNEGDDQHTKETSDGFIRIRTVTKPI
ncbi:unnamed protein product [Leptidea sinapis]|uniref:Uncharacterized protein n=1 Tax=Leptidea sinapis TaxID=189913 RepID=A0A5E4QB18_9NEOP|nr:unnamed protein product [Leptidea sinapis]